MGTSYDRRWDGTDGACDRLLDFLDVVVVVVSGRDCRNGASLDCFFRHLVRDNGGAGAHTGSGIGGGCSAV